MFCNQAGVVTGLIFLYNANMNKKKSLWDTFFGTEEESLFDVLFSTKKEEKRGKRYLGQEECPNCGTLFTPGRTCPGCGLHDNEMPWGKNF